MLGVLVVLHPLSVTLVANEVTTRVVLSFVREIAGGEAALALDQGGE